MTRLSLEFAAVCWGQTACSWLKTQSSSAACLVKRVRAARNLLQSSVQSCLSLRAMPGSPTAHACYASPAAGADLLEGEKGFPDSASAAATSAPGQGLQQQAAAVRNAEWTVRAENISALGKRSPAFVTSHSSAFKN